MPWYTTKTGKHYNTDWNERDRQIAYNKAQADKMNTAEAGKPVKYKDAYEYDDFVKSNLSTLKELYKSDGEEAVKQAWYDTRLAEEKKNLKEIPIEDAIRQMRESIPDRIHAGWFRNADSDYKPHIVARLMGNPGTLNSALNMSYYNYRQQFERWSDIYGKWVPHEGVDQSKKLSFQQWLKTPQKMYRGDYGQKTTGSDLFISYTPNKKIAEKFYNASAGGKMTEIEIAPIDTWGSYQTTGEEEYLIPVSELKKRSRK
jgi:hypothetical protein